MPELDPAWGCTTSRGAQTPRRPLLVVPVFCSTPTVRHYGSGMTDEDDDYLRTTRADIALLPEPLAREAKVLDLGQAEWPRHLAEEVVRALIGLGRVVNVLEDAKYRGGILVETNPLSTYEGSSPEANLRWILPGVELLAEDVSAVVSWHPGD